MDNKTYTPVRNLPLMPMHSSDSDAILSTTSNLYTPSSTINTVITTPSSQVSSYVNKGTDKITID